MTCTHGRPVRPPATTGSSRPTVAIIVVAIIVVAVLAVTGIAALLRGGDDDDRGGTAAATIDPSSPVRPSATESASPAPSRTPTATAPGSKATAPGAKVTTPGSKPSRTFTGTGNQVLNIKKPGAANDPVLVVAAHPGAGSFGVLALDSTLHERDILVNVAGSYAGTTLLDGQGSQTQQLRVRARGRWTLKIMPVTAARSIDAKAKGTGDEVLRYTGGKGVATFDSFGGLNFVVTYYGKPRSAVLVNKVGNYHGQVQIQKGPALIAVSAGGTWSMKVAP